jgi:hypothetical protein
VDATYLLYALVFGGTAFSAGRIFRETTRQHEARRRARRLLGLGPSDGQPNTDTHADSHTHRDHDGAAFYLGQRRAARRRTILRDYSGPRPGRHAAGGSAHIPDAQAVA